MQHTTTQPGNGPADSGGTARRINSLDIAAAFIGYNETPQTANRKPQTANRKPQTANRKPQTANRKPQTANRKPRRPARSLTTSPPEPRRRRIRAHLFLLPVLALLLAALSPFAAAPAAADVLVSNIGQTRSIWSGINGSIKAQGFTTGSHTAGYTLESIEFDVNVRGTMSAAYLGTVKAELWSDNGSGRPNAKLADLTVPSSVSTGAVAFAAPANTTLSASTNYFAVVYSTSTSETNQIQVEVTTATAEDSGAATGWSIANNGLWVDATDPSSVTSWNSANPRTIRVNGSAAQTRSTNANLSGLTAGSSTSSTGTFTDFSIGTFAATDTSYTASVANAQTHVKLTPTVADTGKAKVGVRKGTVGSFTTVTSGSASGAIALDVGANTLTVRVTAEDTTTTKDYTVTVTRRAAQTLSTNANLSGLTAASSTSSAGTFTNFSIGTFAATTTTYTASVANAQTHVKLTPTVADTGATVGVRKGTTGTFTTVTSGSASGALALDVGANTFVVRVTAEDTTRTKDYTVTVTRRAAAPPPAQLLPTVAVVSGTMTVADGGSWKGFQASSNTGALSDTDFTSAGVSYKILGLQLTNSGFLDLQLNKAPPRAWGLVLNVGTSQFKLAEAVLSTGPGYEGVIASWAYANQGETPPDWSRGEELAVSLGTLTSSSATVKLAVRPNPVREGSRVSVEACLLDGDGNRAVPQGRTRIPVTLSHGTSETGDWGVSQSGQTDGSLPVHTAYSIGIDDWFQSSCGSVNIPTHWDVDTDDETFTVALDTASLPPGVEAGTPSTVGVTITDGVDNPRLRDLGMNTGN